MTRFSEVFLLLTVLLPLPALSEIDTTATLPALYAVAFSTANDNATKGFTESLISTWLRSSRQYGATTPSDLATTSVISPKDSTAVSSTAQPSARSDQTKPDLATSTTGGASSPDRPNTENSLNKTDQLVLESYNHNGTITKSKANDQTAADQESDDAAMRKMVRRGRDVAMILLLTVVGLACGAGMAYAMYRRRQRRNDRTRIRYKHDSIYFSNPVYGKTAPY